MKPLATAGTLTFLFLYGIFYHISSSEFWPMTISRTWWSSENFEYSQLQKPLFSFLLSLLHFLPFNDVTHLLAAKLIFTALALLGLTLLTFLVFHLAGRPLKKYSLVVFILIFSCLSPIYLQNFSRVRSDQLTLFLFIAMAFFHTRRQLTGALICLLLIPIVSIKGLIFLLPALFILAPDLYFRAKNLSLIIRINILLCLIAICVWMVAYNIPALNYFTQSYSNTTFPTIFLRHYLLSEGLLFFSAVFVSVYLISKKDQTLRPYAFASLTAALWLITIPQSFPYFIASLAPIIYLPGLVFVLRKDTKFLNFGFLGVQALAVIISTHQLILPLYQSNLDQFKFIARAAPILKINQFNYLDGMGAFPRQKFIACFTSPGDDEANISCRNSIEQTSPDVIMVTQRLNYLGSNVFANLEADYLPVLPNFWIHKKHRAQINEKEVELFNLPIPSIIFSTD